MHFAQPVSLCERGVLLRPLQADDEAALAAAAADGELWRIRVTSVPAPHETADYIRRALDMQAQGLRLPFAVVDQATGRVLGSTSYHDIVPEVRRLEIGHTWYAQSVQRSHVNTCAKLMLLRHAFETLNCQVVGWRTDIFNHRSQRAIERLGAKKDGIIRGNALRRDGSIRDTVMYSLVRGEWPEVQTQLLYLLSRAHSPSLS
jgi:RimJ/RimL family protein N-acetyltransferase